jgi:hypothetical protein
VIISNPHGEEIPMDVVNLAKGKKALDIFTRKKE